MLETIITVAVVAFVLVICGISLYRTFTGKARSSCSSCTGDSSCCAKRMEELLAGQQKGHSAEKKL